MSIDIDLIIEKIQSTFRDSLANEVWSKQILDIDVIVAPATYSIYDFLRFDGELFIAYSFRRLLMRDPSVTEVIAYQGIVGHSAYSKLNVIISMLSSYEFKLNERQITILGLFELWERTSLLLRIKNQRLFNLFAQLTSRGIYSRKMRKYSEFSSRNPLSKTDLLFYLYFRNTTNLPLLSRLFGKVMKVLSTGVLHFLKWPCFFLFESESLLFSSLVNVMSAEQKRNIFEIKRDFEASVLQQMSAVLSEIKTLFSESFRLVEQKQASSTIIASQNENSTYFEYENEFRGSETLIKERLRIYLPYISSLFKENLTSPPVLDVGFGRCEWMSLLQDLNIPTIGIDIDPNLVQRGKELGFQTCCVDAVSWLKSQPKNSFTAITAFHVIEHLEFDYLKEFISECSRVLIPKGLLIFETPNPENLLIGSFEFWLDPTHKRPYPAKTMAFWTKAAGFDSVEIIKINPYDLLSAEGIEHPSLKNIVYRFNIERDYAIIASKPS